MKEIAEQTTILIADDNPKNLQLLHTLLSKEGYRVRVAQNGEQALDSIELEEPDLVLLDIHMPKMDGYEVCRKLKTSSQLKNIPVIFVSALDEVFNKVEAFNAGGVDYIEKPIEAEEVLARVKTHIKIKEQHRLLIETVEKLKITQMALVRNEKMATIGTLVAGISHEFNNPLNYIKSSIEPLSRNMEELLAMCDFCENNLSESSAVREKLKALKIEYEYDLAKKETAQLIENISAGSEKIESLIKRLRDFHSLEESKIETYNVRDGLRTVLSLFAENLHEQGIEVKEELNETPPLYSCGSKLDQLFLIIFTNAVEAFASLDADKKQITLRSKTEGEGNTECVVVECEDNGAGISDDVYQKIFDPFFTTKEVGKGLGLGLSIAFHIMKEHEGEIDVTRGEKTTLVKMKFPLVKNDEKRKIKNSAC